MSQFCVCLLTCLLRLAIPTASTIVKIGLLYDQGGSNVIDTAYDAALRQEVPSDIDVEIILIEQTHTNMTDYLVENELTALISVCEHLYCADIAAVKRLIPIFSVARSVESCDINEEVESIIYLYPPNFSIVSDVVEMAHHYHWDKAILIEEHNNEMLFGFVEMEMLRQGGVDVTPFVASHDDASRKQALKFAKAKGKRVYILCCPVLSVEKILKTAMYLEMTSENTHWFISNPFVQPERLYKLAETGARISTLYIPTVTPVVGAMLRAIFDNQEYSHGHEEDVYFEVVKVLTRFAVDTIARACQTARNSGCLHRNAFGEVICHAQVADIRSWTYTPSTSYTSYGGSHRKKRSVSEMSKENVETANSSSNCSFDATTEEISTSYSRDSGNGLRRAGKVKVAVGRRGYGRCDEHTASSRRDRRSVTGRDERSVTAEKGRRRRAVTYAVPKTCHVLDVPPFFNDVWVERGALLDVNGTDPYVRLDVTPLKAVATVDVCKYPLIHDWLYREGTCSLDFLHNVEIEQANVVLLVEYLPLEESEGDRRQLAFNGVERTNHSTIQPSYGLFTVSDIQLPHRPLRVCAAWHPPWLSWTVGNDTASEFEGYFYDMLQHFVERMNFTYEMVIHPYFSVKQKDAYEAENQLYDIFSNNSCDFALYTQEVHGGRVGRNEKTVDVSLAFQQPLMYLVTKRTERTESTDIWQFMTPFRPDSWAVLWMSLFFVSLQMAWLNMKNPFEYESIATEFGPNSRPSDHLGVLNSTWFNFAALVQQGVEIVPRSKAVKMLTAFWWFFCLTIITAYTANLAMFMTQINQGDITNLHELAAQQEYEYGIISHNHMYYRLLPEASTKPFVLIYQYLKRHENESVFHTQAEAFDRVRAGGFYLISTFEDVVEALRISCQTFNRVGSGFDVYQFGLPFPRGSIYMDKFNDHIAQLRDLNILAQLEEKWFSLEAECEQAKEEVIAGQLDIKAFAGMYVFLLLGCLIGCVIGLFEILSTRYGGFRGIIGKSQRYELRENRRENRKNLKLLEEEFEDWEGGWDVWKCKEWNSGLADESRTGRIKQKIKDTTADQDGPEHSNCQRCGKRLRHIAKSNKKTDVRTLTNAKANSDYDERVQTVVADVVCAPDAVEFTTIGGLEPDPHRRVITPSMVDMTNEIIVHDEVTQHRDDFPRPDRSNLPDVINDAMPDLLSVAELRPGIVSLPPEELGSGPSLDPIHASPPPDGYLQPPAPPGRFGAPGPPEGFDEDDEATFDFDLPAPVVFPDNGTYDGMRVGEYDILSDEDDTSFISSDDYYYDGDTTWTGTYTDYDEEDGSDWSYETETE